MKTIGIVGGIGAGKTTVVSILKELTNAWIIGADEIGHKILLKGDKAYQKVIDTFGTDILDTEGQIVRSKLGAIVFGDREQLLLLNQITHPLIHEEVKAQMVRAKEEGSYSLIVIDAALLIEIGLVALTDYVIGVYADEQTRIARIMLREHYTEEQALQRIKKQKKWEELEKMVDYVIDNSKSYDQTLEQVKGILEDVRSQG